MSYENQKKKNSVKILLLNKFLSNIVMRVVLQYSIASLNGIICGRYETLEHAHLIHIQ